MATETAKAKADDKKKGEDLAFTIDANDAFALPALDAWIYAARQQNAKEATINKVADLRAEIADYQNANGAEVPTIA